MILGKAIALDASAQTSLAVWATKTLLMLQLTHQGNRRAIPGEQFRWFREHRWPFPGEQLWIGAYDGSGDWPIAYHHFAIGLYDATVSDPPEDLNGHVAAFSIGQLVFRAFGKAVKIDVTAAPQGTIAAAMRQIWPASGDTIHFPPPVTARGNAGIRALIDSFGVDASDFG